MLAVSRRNLLLGACGLITTGAAAESDNELVVTTNGGSFEKYDRAVTFPAFEKLTGAKILTVSGLTMQDLSKLRAARGNPTVDILRMDPPGAVPASREGLLEKLDPDRIPNIKNLPAWGVPASGDYVAVAADYQVLAYHTKAPGGPPGSWRDLWKPENKGRVIIPDISTSHGIMFVAMVSHLVSGGFYDTDAAFAELVKLKPNVLTYWTSHDQVTQLLTSGQAWLAPWIADRCVNTIHSGAPVDLVVPHSEGAIFKPTDLCISKGTRHLKMAEAYVNYLLDADVQKRNAEANFNGPSNRLTRLDGIAAKYYNLADFNLLPLDWGKLTDVQSAWADRWNRTMVQ